MAHKLANDNYRHKGVTITKKQIPTSTGWGFVWKVRGRKYETLKLAVKAIDDNEQQ